MVPFIHKINLEVTDPRIALVRDTLRHDPAIGMRALAERVNLSPSRLGHLFRAQTGASIAQYRSQARLGEGAVRLRPGTKQIKEVAFELGYRHPASFTRAFRREFGQPPRAYRLRK